MGLHTRTFKVPVAALFTYVMRRRLLGSHAGKAVSLSAAVLLTALILLGILHDVRYAILALLIICIVLPFSLVIFYVSDALRLGVFFNSLPHVVALSGETLIVSLPQEENSLLCRFPLRECAGYSVGASYVSVMLGPAHSDGAVILPADAFGSVERLNEFLLHIPTTCHKSE